MATTMVIARYPSPDATAAIDERTLEVDAVPEVGEVWWYGEPYVVRARDGEAPVRVELVLDAERLLGYGARVPSGFALAVRRPVAVGQWDAVVLNVEGGVAGYGRDPDDGDAAAEAALKDAGL